MTKRIYVVLQGGGAKGISHLGALRALERDGIEILGVAGTSAGAIVAALKAAGYSACDMLDPDNRTTILSQAEIEIGFFKKTRRIARSPKDLFGSFGWHALSAARFFSENIQAIRDLYLFVFIWSITFSLLLSPLFFWSVSFLILLPLAGVLWLMSGLASLDVFSNCLNGLLAKKFGLTEGSSVTFSDFERYGASPLKIIASDVQGETVRVFSASLTPQVSVAEAVAASACIPGIFKARKFDGASHFDGGLVSNLPAWVFDEERALDPNAATITFEIVSKASQRGAVSGLAALVGAVKTGLFGRGVLEKRAVGNLYSIGFNPNVKLLDFDMSFELAADEFQKSYSDCELRLVSRLIELPNIMEEICSLLSEAAKDLIRAIQEEEGVSPTIEMPRVAILLQPFETFNSLKVCFCHGFSDFYDGALTLPIDRSIVGQAWLDGASIMVTRADPEWGATLDRPQDQATKRLVKDSLDWVIAIPYESADVEGARLILALDGHAPLELSEAARRKLVEELTFTMKEMLDELVPIEVFEDGY
jgi:NTE family protein